MKRLPILLLCLMMAAALTACTAQADQHSGEAQGYGGILRVTVSMNGTDITDVKVVEHHETEGVGTRAIDALPQAIIDADSADVDIVSGATVTSEAIRTAVRNAMGETNAVPQRIPAPDDSVQEPAGLMGVGMASTGRVGPGADSEGKQVYSFNVVFAAGSFDEDGTIRAMKVDQLEVVTPNLGGGSAFSGFPADETGVNAFMEEVSSWTTKGAKGDGYMLDSGSWRDQMNAYEAWFVGRTVDEVMQDYERLFDQDTGRPLASGEKHDALSDADRKAVSDVTSGATISLRGPYGDILTAVQRAWEDAQRSRPDAMDSQATEEATQSPTEGPLVDTNLPTDATDGDETVG